jgi:hypothetical protein
VLSISYMRPCDQACLCSHLDSRALAHMKPSRSRRTVAWRLIGAHHVLPVPVLRRLHHPQCDATVMTPRAALLSWRMSTASQARNEASLGPMQLGALAPQ